MKNYNITQIVYILLSIFVLTCCDGSRVKKTPIILSDKRIAEITNVNKADKFDPSDDIIDGYSESIRLGKWHFANKSPEIKFENWIDVLTNGQIINSRSSTEEKDAFAFKAVIWPKGHTCSIYISDAKIVLFQDGEHINSGRIWMENGHTASFHMVRNDAVKSDEIKPLIAYFDHLNDQNEFGEFEK